MHKIFLDHIPKTGGTAVTRAVYGAIGADAAAVPDLRLLGTVRYSDVLADYESLPMVAAHCGFDPAQVLARDRLHAVLLRDPIDRLLSAYAFNRADVSHHNRVDGYVRNAKEQDLESFLLGASPGVPGVATNWYVEHFMPLGWNGDRLDGPEDRFECAMRGLRRFDVIGFQDATEEFCDVICGAACITTLPRLEIVNATSQPLRVSDIDHRLLTALRERLAWDYRLFDAARELARQMRAARAMHAAHDNRASAPTQNAEAPKQDTEPTRDLETPNAGARIIGVRVTSDLSGESECLTEDFVTIEVQILADRPITLATVGLGLKAPTGKLVFGTNSRILGKWVELAEGVSSVAFRFQNRLGCGEYAIEAALSSGRDESYGLLHIKQNAATLRVPGTLGEAFEGQLKLYPVLDSWGCASLEACQMYPMQPAAFVAVTERMVPLADFRANMELLSEIPQMRSGTLFTLRIKLTNRSLQKWRAAGLNHVTLSYQWHDASLSAPVVFDGMRTELPFDLGSGQSYEGTMRIAAPNVPGRFVLLVSPVQEGVAWFCDRGFDAPRRTVDVRD